MKTRTTSLKRLAAGAGALSLAMVGLIGTAATAAVEPGPGNITGTTGTLTIHKHSGNPTVMGDGTEITDEGAIASLGAGLVGVEFSIERVTRAGDPIDLTTTAGWDDAQDATVADVQNDANGFGVSAADGTASATTIADGLAEVNNLPYGLYLVTETNPGANNIVSPVAPFLVSIPYPADGSWLYNVHVYPKNKLNTTEAEKTVEDPGYAVVVGSILNWTITAPVPAKSSDDTYRSFTITDDLDGRLVPQSVTVSSNGTALGSSDYTITPSLPGTAGATVTVKLTSTGLEKIAAGDVITVDLSTEVGTLGETNVFENEAVVNTNDSQVTTGKPAVYYGALEVNKYDEESESALSGAEFSLYEADENGEPTGDPIASGVTGPDGKLTFDGLWAGTTADASRDYVLVETKAPAGYVLPEDASVVVTIYAASENASVNVTSQSVSNTQQDGPNLPLTGSTGTLLFTIVGIALIATGGTIAAVRHSRSKA
nr:SpaH/EbpB family LPXTG-anchored major pilin [Pseudactinotalea sp. HY160]